MTGSIIGKVQSSLVVKIIHDGELLAIKLGLIYLVLYTSYHVVCPLATESIRIRLRRPV